MLLKELGADTMDMPHGSGNISLSKDLRLFITWQHAPAYSILSGRDYFYLIIIQESTADLTLLGRGTKEDCLLMQ